MKNTDKLFRDSTILLVDDVPENLQVLGSIFATKNANLIVASDGQTAINSAKEDLPDIILLDIAIPDINGYDIAKALKEDETTKDIPIIFITAKASQEDIQKGFELGAADYITKPFNSAELLMRVTNHLELAKARKELVNMIDDKNKFISLVAHDIKSPLGGIMKLMKILAEDFSDIEKEEQLEIINDVYESIVNQYRFVDDLLKWGSLQLNRVDLKKDIVEVSSLIKNIIDVHKINAGNKNIQIIEKISTERKILADPILLENIISNLISNAIKFSKEDSEIIVEVQDDLDKVVISIADNGVGISDTDKLRLFKKGIIHTTKGTNNELGTGLGLLLVKEMVEKNNGTIHFESELGKGTTFFITLPTV